MLLRLFDHVRTNTLSSKAGIIQQNRPEESQSFFQMVIRGHTVLW